ncbi:MAG: hypothetical protein A3F42_03725 [Gammaproteobacteria bacterium RIFCSPHIGHO2_12_FULL_37_34]|nr:MAG: hypothetical protein A3F42_03725 [Gammaproteobacteria bacterium RIFCSPHIGHO2_12_FULL_37_34]
MTWLNKIKSNRSINSIDIIIFLRQFTTLLLAGIPIMQSCDILVTTQEKKSLRALIDSIRFNISTGKALSYSLNIYKHYFDDLTCPLITIGEHTGKLDEMFMILTAYHEKKLAFSRKIQQIIFYPCMVMVISLWIVCGLLLFVIPRFVELFQDSQDKLPLLTHFIFYCSFYFRSYIIIFFFLIQILIIFLIYHQSYRKKITSYLIYVFVRLPLIKERLLKIIFARFARQLAMTLHAGIPITDALKLVSTLHTDPTYLTAVTLVRHQLISGRPLHRAMQMVAYFPELMIQMIKIGEETGKLDDMLDKTADFIESDIDQMTAQLSKMIEPLIMLFLGVLIGGIVIGMYLPIFKLGTTF